MTRHVQAAVIPSDEQTPEPAGDVPMAFGTVASLWSRYSQSVADRVARPEPEAFEFRRYGVAALLAMVVLSMTVL